MTTQSGDSGGSLEVLVHPLVVMSIADHYTRTKQQQIQNNLQAQQQAQAKAAADKKKGLAAPAPIPPTATNTNARVFGLCFGNQSGLRVNVLETVEMAYKVEGGHVVIAQAELEKDMKLFSASYPSYECLGWYSTGGSIQPEDAELHKQFTKYNERPLYLLLNPDVNTSNPHLPLTVFSQTIHVLNDKSSSEFTVADWMLSADEAERITSYHCAQVVNKTENESEIIPHFTSLSKAVSSLHERLLIVRQFLQDTKSGKIPTNQSLLRDIKSLLSRLPLQSSTEFKSSLISEYEDAMVLTELATLTKCLEVTRNVTKDFSTVYSSSGVGGVGDMRGGGGKRRGIGAYPGSFATYAIGDY